MGYVEHVFLGDHAPAFNKEFEQPAAAAAASCNTRVCFDRPDAPPFRDLRPVKWDRESFDLPCTAEVFSPDFFAVQVLGREFLGKNISRERGSYIGLGY